MGLSRNARGGHRKRGSKDKKKAKARDKNLAKRVAAAARATAEAMADLAEPEYDSEDEQPERVRDGAQQERSRQLMVWKFVDMGSPPEDKWSGTGGVLAEIRKLLGWHYNRDVAPIRTLLRRHLNDEPLVKPRAGRPAKLTQGEALIGADCLESGKGRGQAAHQVSAWRQLQGKSAVSEMAVRTGFKRLDGVTQRRGTDGTGSRDVESAWAQASLVEAEQLTSQIVMPEEEERAAAEQEVEAAATGPWLKVEGRRVRSLADDPLHVIGKGEHITVPYSRRPHHRHSRRPRHVRHSRPHHCPLLHRHRLHRLRHHLHHRRRRHHRRRHLRRHRHRPHRHRHSHRRHSHRRHHHRPRHRHRRHHHLCLRPRRRQGRKATYEARRTVNAAGRLL